MQPERIDELWERFLTEKLDDAGARELLVFLQSNPDELQRRRAEASVHGGLRYLFGNDEDSRRLMESVQARLKSIAAPGEESAFEKRVMSEVRHRKRVTGRQSSWWIPAAAAVALVVGIYFAGKQYRTEPVDAGPAVVSKAISIDVLSGQASVGSRTFTNKAALKLQEGEAIKLSPGAVARATLPDGSEVKLSDSAELLLQHLEAPTRLKLLQGIADLNVRPQEKGKELTLETLQARVRVLGTRYRVVASEGASRVDVEQGKVAVTSVQKTKDSERTLEVGQAVTVDDQGVGKVVAARSRTLSPNDAQVEGYTDPVVLSACDTPAPWPARRLTYARPGNKGYGYGGVFWKVPLDAGEETFEIWIRPRSIELANPDYRLMKVVMLASTGPTEYRIGDVHLFPSDRHWTLLRGRFTGATVNWQEPNTPAKSLLSQNVRQISLRTEIGNIEFDFSPIQIINTAK